MSHEPPLGPVLGVSVAPHWPPLASALYCTSSHSSGSSARPTVVPLTTGTTYAVTSDALLASSRLGRVWTKVLPKMADRYMLPVVLRQLLDRVQRASSCRYSHCGCRS